MPTLPINANEKAILLAILMILSGVSAYFSFHGALLIMAELAQGLQGRIGAGVYALGSWAVLYILWRQAFLTLPLLEPEQIIGSLLSVAMICVLATGLSGVVNVAYIAGNAALKLEMTHMVRQAEQAIHTKDQAMSRVAVLSHDLADQATTFRTMAMEDRSTGRHSGFPGGGAFTTAADQIATALSRLDQHMAATITAHETQLEAAHGHINTMREITLRQEVPIPLRMAALSEEIQAINAKLVGISAEGLTSTMDRSLTRFTHMTEAMRPTSQRPDVAADQARAIAVLQSQMALTVSILRDAMAELATLDTADLIAAEPASVMLAIFKHGEQFIPQWIGGLAIDLAPLVLLILLRTRVQLQRLVTDRTTPTDPMLSLSQVVAVMEQVKGVTTTLHAAQPQQPKQPKQLPSPEGREVALPGRDGQPETHLLPPQSTASVDSSAKHASGTQDTPEQANGRHTTGTHKSVKPAKRGAPPSWLGGSSHD